MIINFSNIGPGQGGGSGSGVTPQQVEEQIQSALTPYWDSAATEDAISAATSGKADAATVSPNTDKLNFPQWNAQGIITGGIYTGYRVGHSINGTNYNIVRFNSNTPLPSIYAPLSAGTAGEVLVSTGNGAPVWSAFTGGDMSGYWTSAETQSAITEAYDSATTHIDEVEQIMSSALNEFHTQIIDLSGETQGLKSNFGFISGRVQTNEQVLATAVNDVNDMKIRFSAYTPTSGFSTINGSAITNGGNLVVETDLSNYTPTTGFATVNGSAITNGGNLVVEATLPMANQNTLGGVKVGDYNYGSALFIQSDGMLNIATDRLSISEAETSNQTKSVLPNWEVDRNDSWAYDPGYVLNIPFFSLSASVSFKSSELAEHYGDVSDNELFGATYAPNQEESHLYLYYNKEEEQDPYFTFNDLEQTGELPRFDLVDGTSAFTFAVTGEDGNEYTYTANVTVANGDDVSVVITIRNDSEDKDAGVDIWSAEIEMGAPITLNGSPDIALAKFGREFDPDLGDAVQKWSKYYNEDNINEVTDNLVKNEGGVSGIWKGTQAQYDTLTQSGATANPNTFYIIIPSA